MVGENGSLVTDQNRGVPYTAKTSMGTFVESYMGEDLILRTGLLECSYLLAIDR